ncbi:MAG: hypothetical protein NTZ38_03415 [Candidatus Taylorbacteria bacterium]|nr:hypothetical protein [Candidatus Taylorbacteria bacterium]
MSKFRGGSQKGQIPSAPVKKAGFLVVFGILSLIMLVIIVFLSLSHRKERQARKTDATQIESSRPHGGMGIITVTTNGSETVLTGGNSIMAVPLSRVRWQQYFDTNLVTFEATGTTSATSSTRVDLPFSRVSWRLCPGQGVASIKVAYFLYSGSKPPDDWYDTVLRNCPQ